jgi:hypothetical protein
MASHAKGACLCGAVQFELTLPTKWVAHCHCSICRRAHGAPYVTWASVPSAQLRIVAGADHVRRFDSSPAATRSSCMTCGSPLFFESTRWGGEVHVAVGCIEDALDRAPQVHAFFSDKADWVAVHDELPRRGGKTGTEPLG